MNYDLNKKILEFSNNLIDRDNLFHRYRSWEHCFENFNIFRKKRSLTPQDKDFLALHLSMYLSSWGMYRGSTFLLEHDYKLQVGLIDVLWKYKHLYSMKFEQLPEFIDDILKLDREIRSYYESEGRKYTKNNKEYLIKVSDTLSSKIIMGSLGCLPAYDRFFIRGLEQLKISKSYNKNGFLAVYEFFKLGKIDFKACRKEINHFRDNKLEYPDMKLIDMALFQLGMSLKPKKVIKIDKTRTLAVLEDNSFRILDASNKEVKNTKKEIAKILEISVIEAKKVNTRELGSTLLKKLKKAS